MEMTASKIEDRDDWLMVASWWKAGGVKLFTWADLPEDTSFLCFVDGTPALAASLILTNSKFAWVEAFVGNPETPKEVRREATKWLLTFLESAALSFGAKKLFCMSPVDKLTSYYEGLGFKKSAHVDTLIKEIECLS